MDTLRYLYRDTYSSALTLGVGTVLLTHSAMVMNMLPGSWSESQKQNHAYINLAAVGAIIYGSRMLN